MKRSRRRMGRFVRKGYRTYGANRPYNRKSRRRIKHGRRYA